MRAENDFGRPKAIRFEPRQFLDQRRVIGAEIAEQIFDVDLVEPLQEVMGSRMRRGVGRGN